MAKWGEAKLTEKEKKAREEKKKEEQEKKEAERKRKEKNRQINYFVMRYMWQVIRGRNADESIHLAFNMSRERYTRIIETGKVHYKNNELDFLKAKTGIPKEIFSGDIRFTFPDKDGKDKVSDEDWEKLFILRTKRREERALLKDRQVRNKEISNEEKAGYKEASEEYKKAEASIGNILRESKRKGESPFQRLCSFLKNGYGSRLETLQEINQVLAYITMTLLDECSKTELESLRKALMQKEQAVKAVLMYRSLKNDFKKN